MRPSDALELHIYYEGEWYSDTCNDMWPYWTVMKLGECWRYDTRHCVGCGRAATLEEAKAAVEADYKEWCGR